MTNKRKEKALPLAGIRLFLFDLDGTLYLGERLFPYTVGLLEKIRRSGRRYLFMTNNSSKSAADYVRKLDRLGIAATEEDFVTSSEATAQYLLAHYRDRCIYVGGTRSLLAEFRAAGLDATDILTDKVHCVVCGFDTELTFRKLEDLSRLLRDPDIPFIATHPDLVCPTEYGAVPDCGAVCEMLYHATGRRPTVIGKPEPFMARMAMQRTGYGPEQTLVVGDRLYTDIACGRRAGAYTLLVLSGETTEEMLRASSIHPTACAADCGELLSALECIPDTPDAL